MRFPHVVLKQTRLFTPLALTAFALGACDAGSSDPMGPPPEEEPKFKTVYDVDFDIQNLRASSGQTCDGLFFGNADPGEFHWRIAVTAAGSGQSEESKGFGKASGRAYVQGPGTYINFTPWSYSWTSLESTEELRVELQGLEWDVLTKDKSLLAGGNPATSYSTHPTNRNVGNRTSLSIGNDACGLTLNYSYRITPRQVAL